MRSESLLYLSGTIAQIWGREYLPELARARAQRDETLQKKKDESMNRLMSDLAVDRKANPRAAALDRWDPNVEEDEDDGGDLNIIDKSESHVYILRSRLVTDYVA